MNLTDIWKATGADPAKKPGFWIRWDPVKELMAELLSDGKYAPTHILRTKTGRRGGILAHWQLAISYARFLDVKFHIWTNNLVMERFQEMSDPELGIERAAIRNLLLSNQVTRWRLFVFFANNGSAKYRRAVLEQKGDWRSHEQIRRAYF